MTQNDPLGALNIDALESEEEKQKESTMMEMTNNNNNNNNNIGGKDQHLFTDKPILFRGQRSATFDESIPLNSNMQRSETMPGSSVTSSLANLGSTLKFNFG